MRTGTLMSIKEFSEMSGLKPSILRHWGDIGLLRPVWRDDYNNYRYYSPDQLLMVNFIKVLSSLHIPLKDIKKISKNRTPESILRLMDQQERVLDAQLSRLHEAYSTIHVLRAHIKPGMDLSDTDQISVQSLEAMPIVLGPPNEPWEGENFYETFARYCRYAKETRVNLNNPVGGYYESMDAFLQAPGVPARFFSVDPNGSDQRAAGKYLVGYARGYYGRMGDAAQRLAAFARQQRLKPGGPVYVIYLLDEISTQEPSDYLAQICAAL